MNAVILYDSRTKKGSTEALIDSIGLKLAEAGVYVEKAKCKAMADYRFVQEFDIVILGAPVYYFVVSSQLLAALIHGNLKKNLRHKKIALFLTCGSSESMATLLYLPQLKMHLVRNKILAEKIIATSARLQKDAIDEFVDDILVEYDKTLHKRALSKSVQWSDEAMQLLDSIPPFMQSLLKGRTEQYAQEMGYKVITLAVCDAAKDALGREI
ncbi:MAG: flavodoxin domain-containing protein [Chlorobiaceae bacterium]